MKDLKPLIPRISLGALILAAGLWLGYPSADPKTAGSADGSNPAELATRRSQAEPGTRIADPRLSGASRRSARLLRASRLSPDATQSMAQFEARLADMNPEDLEAALEMCRDQRPFEMNAAVSMLFSKWGDLDPEAALQVIEGKNGTQVPGDNLRDVALDALVRSWCRRDLKSATQYLAQRKEVNPLSLDARYTIAAQEYAQFDPEAAVEWANSLNGPLNQAAALGAIGKITGRKEGDAQQQGLIEQLEKMRR